MKFYEKYPQLQEKHFLSKMLSETVYSTMSLEDQTVAMPKIKQLVREVIAENESKSGQLFGN
ncbi:MAG: hypothetical protein ACI9V1_001390 [Spirosomataceae bacterium]|jgi:hypothetical protein